MNKITIQNWAKDLVEANPDNLNDPDNYIKHLGQVYDLAEKVVKNILVHYPNIPLVEEEVSLAAGLHDIGRPLQKDQIFHELRSARYFEQKGLEKGVSTSLRDIYRIAQMFRSHGCVYEHWLDPDFVEIIKEFEPLEACLLIPRTWQEAIVTYSDSASKNGELIGVECKISEVLNRYGNDPKYQNEKVIRAVRASQPRLLELAERVEALEQGKLTEPDIARYGFL